MFKLPDKAEENDTSEKRRQKTKIPMEFKSMSFTAKTTEKGKEEKKGNVMMDLDAFFGEVKAPSKEEKKIENIKEEKKQENKEGENEEEYEYEYVDE